MSAITNRPFAPIKLSNSPVESQTPQELALAAPPPESASPDVDAVYWKVVGVTAVILNWLLGGEL